MSILNNLQVKTRLTLLVGISILTSVIIGGLGLHAMRNADQAISSMYQVDIHHINLLEDVRTHMDRMKIQFLAGLQHDPSSPTASLHDHPLSMHLNAIEKSIQEVNALWRDFSNEELDENEKSLATNFIHEWEQLTNQGVQPVINDLNSGDFIAAYDLLMKKINPGFDKTSSNLGSLLEIQSADAEKAFKETDASYHFMFNVVSATIVIGALLCAVLAYLTIAGISFAVKRIESAANALAEGDLNARVDIHSKDEMGHIAKTVNRMAESFRDTVSEVRDAITRLAAAAEETSVVTAQTTAGINQQQTETSQVATAINEMSATVQEVAKNAVEAAAAAQEADATFDEGKQVINRVINAIGDLASEVDNTSGVIKQLEQESVNIGSVLDVIKSIAEQTNLLALNAAIEAARAGEQGRGFAVVADEVRTLAGRTQGSTLEIEEMINRLQGDAKKAVKAMEAGKEMTHVGVEQAAAAGEALRTINAAVERISGMNTQIASAAEEQSTVTEEINRSIVSINEVAEQSAVGAQQTAAASDELAKLADQLKGLVDRFKV